MAAGIETGRSSAIVSSSKELYQYRIVSWTDSICAGLAIDRWRTDEGREGRCRLLPAVCCLLSATPRVCLMFIKDFVLLFDWLIRLIDSFDWFDWFDNSVMYFQASKQASYFSCTFWKWEEQTVQQLTTRTQSGVSVVSGVCYEHCAHISPLHSNFGSCSSSSKPLKNVKALNAIVRQWSPFCRPVFTNQITPLTAVKLETLRQLLLVSKPFCWCYDHCYNGQHTWITTVMMPFWAAYHHARLFMVLICIIAQRLRLHNGQKVQRAFELLLVPVHTHLLACYNNIVQTK